MSARASKKRKEPESSQSGSSSGQPTPKLNAELSSSDAQAGTSLTASAITWQTSGHEWLRRRVCRFGVCGTVVKWSPAEADDFALWHVVHDDGDKEDLEEYEMVEALAAFKQRASGGSSAEAVAARVLLQGAYAHKHIRLGDGYQAVVPLGLAPSPGEGQERLGEEDDEGRAGELQVVEFTPLTEPPKPLPIPTASDVAAAAAAEAEAKARARAEVEAVSNDFDSDGEPIVPVGMSIGGFCRAQGPSQGTFRWFKAVLLQVRKVSPHLLVKYVAGDDGKKCDRLLLPSVPKSFLRCIDVEAWVEPGERPAAGTSSLPLSPSAGGADNGATSSSSPSAAAAADNRARSDRQGESSRSSRRVVRARPRETLLTDAGGLKLHLDPHRKVDGYAGTGYRGVTEDSWPTGYKKERPFAVSFDGRYQGRYATVEQAAVAYARLELGMPPLVI
jgi:hypothetical protein